MTQPEMTQPEMTQPEMTQTHVRSGFDRKLIAPMVLGAILNPVNSSILAVSLIPIGRAFHAPPSQTSWLVTSLYVATAVGQPVAGRLVDRFGPRRLYLAATALIGIAGVIGTLAPDLPTLVVARILLGFGTCAGYPSAMYLIRSEAARTGEDSPGGVLTTLAVSAQTIAVLGPTLGGLLIGVGGWRATLAVNVPLSLVCLVLGARRLPRQVVVAADPEQADPEQADPEQADHNRPTTSGGLARALLGNRPLLATYLRQLLAGIVSYSFLYGFTQWLEDGRGLSATVSGLLLLPVFGIAILVSVTTGRRKEIRLKLVVGSVAQLVACLLMLGTGDHAAIGYLVLIAVVIGIPQGLLSLANQNAVYYQADPARMGASAGLLRTSMYSGAILASFSNGLFLGQRADIAGLHDVALFVVAISALNVVVTVVDRSLGRVGAAKPSGEPS
jgi:MFS family permease